MSADNYLLIRRHPRGGYAIVTGFASDQYARQARYGDAEYATLSSAVIAAQRIMDEEVYEYGMQIEREIVNE